MLFLDGIALTLTVITLICIFVGRDAMYIEALTVAWIAEAAHFHQVYAKKESRANCQKYAQQWIDKIGEKYGWEAAARFAEIVLKE
jgi:hypothetical protein